MTKHRATKTQDVSQEYGKPAWLYSDGSVRGERGHMIVKLDNHGKDITRQNAHAYAEARANKVQQAIQAAITQAGGVDKIPGSGPAEVIGAAAGLLWADMVRGRDANGQPVYMRDRINVWETIGKRAGLLEDRRQEAPAASAIAGLLGLALGIAAQRGEAGVPPAAEPQAVDGIVTDAAAEDEAEAE